jgi:hypothetical protein
MPLRQVLRFQNLGIPHKPTHPPKKLIQRSPRQLNLIIQIRRPLPNLLPPMPTFSFPNKRRHRGQKSNHHLPTPATPVAPATVLPAAPDIIPTHPLITDAPPLNGASVPPSPAPEPPESANHHSADLSAQSLNAHFEHTHTANIAVLYQVQYISSLPNSC